MGKSETKVPPDVVSEEADTLFKGRELVGGATPVAAGSGVVVIGAVIGAVVGVAAAASFAAPREFRIWYFSSTDTVSKVSRHSPKGFEAFTSSDVPEGVSSSFR